MSRYHSQSSVNMLHSLAVAWSVHLELRREGNIVNHTGCIGLKFKAPPFTGSMCKSLSPSSSHMDYLYIVYICHDAPSITNQCSCHPEVCSAEVYCSQAASRRVITGVPSLRHPCTPHPELAGTGRTKAQSRRHRGRCHRWERETGRQTSKQLLRTRQRRQLLTGIAGDC